MKSPNNLHMSSKVETTWTRNMHCYIYMYIKIIYYVYLHTIYSHIVTPKKIEKDRKGSITAYYHYLHIYI
jgi:hypothetical protein